MLSHKKEVTMPRSTIEAQTQVDRKPFSAAHDCFEALLTRLEGQKCMGMSHSELERVIEIDGRELLRCLFQGHLDLRSAGEVDSRVLGADDNDVRERGRKRERNLESVFGTVTVGRAAYTKPGQRSLFVLDGYLNLPPELYSFGLRRTVAIEAAKVSFDEVVAAVERSTGVTVPKRQAEQLVRRAAVDFDAFYEQRAHDEIVEEDEILVITTDGKGICMLVEHLRPATRKAAKKRQPKLDKRQSKGEKSKKRRMAQVAAVYTVARFERGVDDIVGALGSTTTTAPSAKPKRPKPHNKRVWASVTKDPWDVIDEAFNEAKRLDPGHEKHWVVLIDGGADQLEGVLECVGSAGCEVTMLIDIIHVLEYLWGAGRALLGEGTLQSQSWVTERLRALLEGKDIGQMAAGMRRSATMRKLSVTLRKPVDKCADYLLKYSSLMNYAQALDAGLPISTGVIEGVCRYLVRDRMDITGARWSVDGAEAVLRLRALRASGDFDEYWCFHEACEFRRNHLVRYADEAMPERPASGQTPSRAHLRLVS
jgi:hypothetical protein